MLNSVPLALMKMRGCRKTIGLSLNDTSTTSNCLGKTHMKEYRSDVGTHFYH